MIPEPLAARLEGDRTAAAVVEGWRLSHLGNRRAIRRLEADLAAAGPRHPLIDAATVLRIAWRQASGDPALATEALALLEPRLAHGAQGGSGLIQRARLAAAAAAPDTALASLLELNAFLHSRSSQSKAHDNLAREAIRILSALPPSARDDPRFGGLKAELSVLGGS